MTVKIREFSWLLVLGTAWFPIGLLSWYFGAPWVDTQIDSAAFEAFAVLLFFLCWVYFAIYGAWPAELTADKNKVTIQKGCPFLFSQQVILVSDILKIRIRDYSDSGYDFNGLSYSLEIESKQGTKVYFGNGRDLGRSKVESWRDEIVTVTGIDNLTRVRS